MSQPLPTPMSEALDLVLSNRLTEATALIQARLGGSFADTAPPAPRFDGPTIELQAEVEGSGTPRQPTTDALPRSRPRFPWADAAALRPDPVRASAPPIPPGAKFLSLVHAGPAGRRAYRLYIPAAPAGAPRPLVVMLHGCTQSPEDFATGTRMNGLAEEMNFLVAYPEQDRSANASLCWNWFEPGDQRRGAGEPAILAAIVADIAQDHSVDQTRVFAAGLSAGGAMAAVLGATYPDVFAAVGIHSGLPHASANNVASALAVMRSGRTAGNGMVRGSRAIVFHGASDRTVHPLNGECMAGLTGTLSASSRRSTGAANGRAYTCTTSAGRGGSPAVEHWQIEGLGHAWSGGDARGSYTDAAGPDASREMLRFFLQDLTSTT